MILQLGEMKPGVKEKSYFLNQRIKLFRWMCQGTFWKLGVLLGGLQAEQGVGAGLP